MRREAPGALMETHATAPATENATEQGEFACP